MKTKKRFKLINRSLGFLLALCLLIFSYFVYRVFFYTDFWWRFSTGGEIYSNLTFDKRSFYFGNNSSILYSVDIKTGKEKWRFEDFQSSVLNGPVLSGKLVLFSTESGVLYAIDSKTGKSVWQLSNPEGYRFVTVPQTYKNMVLVGDSGGTLYSLNLKNGEVRWKFEVGEVSKLSDVLVDSYLNWFGIFKIERGTVYLGSRDGNLYALSIKSGDIVWKFYSGSAITTEPTLSKGNIYFGNSVGQTYRLDQKTGELISKNETKDAPVTCITILPGGFFEKDPVVINVYTGGKLEAARGDNILWEFSTQQSEVRCPIHWKESLVLVDASGTIRSLNAKSGAEVWKFTSQGGLQYTPILRDRFIDFDLHALKFKLNVPTLFFGDKEGNVFAINAVNGKVLWNFKAFSKINASPKIVGKHIFFQSSDGGVYKLRSIDGRLDKPYLYNLTFKPKFTKTSSEAGSTYFHETSVDFDESFFTNPFREAFLTGEYWQDDNKKIKVDGFYFDKDVWMIRFAPVKSGKWYYKVVFSYPGKSFEDVGEFYLQENEVRNFLKVSQDAKRRLTRDGKTVFNALGIQNSMLDTNYNGNPFDDWATGDSSPLKFSSSSGNYSFASDQIVGLDDYLKLYSREGGFNLFRWGPGNSSFRLWSDYSVKASYLNEWGKQGDKLMHSLVNNNYGVWFTLFSFDIPYSQTMRPVEYDLLNSYIDYIVARYGVFVDIWEVGNEVYAPDYVVDHIAARIKDKDYLVRPVSTSWEKPQLANVDIISPHWYETENLADSDTSVIRKLEKYKQWDKPIIFGEQGNQKVNWDETSAERMRIRSWTAFFEEVSLIFWNDSSRKDYYNATLNNANIFIGPDERKYMLNLTNFTNGVDLSIRKFNHKLNTKDIRSYGLVSQNELLGYFFHYKNPGKKVVTSLELTLPKKGRLVWYSPALGSVLEERDINSGYQIVTSPVFDKDLALKIVFY